MSVGGLWMGTSTWVYRLPCAGIETVAVIAVKTAKKKQEMGERHWYIHNRWVASHCKLNWGTRGDQTMRRDSFGEHQPSAGKVVEQFQLAKGFPTEDGTFSCVVLCDTQEEATRKFPAIRCGKRVYGHASMVLYLFTGVVHKQAGSQLWLLILSDQGLVYEEEEGDRCGIVLREHSGSGSVTVSWWMNLENRGLVKDQEMRIWQTISGFIGSREGDHLSTSLYHIFSADLFPTCIDLLDREIPRLVGTVNYVGFTSFPPRREKGDRLSIPMIISMGCPDQNYKSFRLVNRCKFLLP